MNLINCLIISYLIIPSHPLQYCVGGLGQFKLFEYSFSDFPIPPSLSVSRAYVNLINCLNTVHLIILFRWHPLHLSPDRTWTSIVWIPFIWSSYSFIFIRLQNVSELCQLFKSSNLIIPSHPLEGSELGQIIWIPIIWSSYPIVFIRLQKVREFINLLKIYNLIIPSPFSPDRMWTCSIVWIPLLWSSCPVLFIHHQTVRELGRLF